MITCHSFYFFHHKYRIDFSDSARNWGTVPRNIEGAEEEEGIEAGSENSEEDVLPVIGDIQSNPENLCIFLQIYRDTTKNWITKDDNLVLCHTALILLNLKFFTNKFKSNW